MLWLQRHSTAVLYGTFALTVVLMIFCIITFYYYAIIDLNRPEGSNTHPYYVMEYSLMFCVFFGTANAMIIFRMFSLNLVTLIVHALIHLVVVVCLIVHLVLFHSLNAGKSFYHTYSIQIYVMLAVYLLQCLVALDLIIFKPGKTDMEREKRSGLHAFFGVITFVVMFWNMTLMLSMLCINPKHSRSTDEKLSYGELLIEPSFLIVFVALYMLLILFILLTPFFRADARVVSSTEEKFMLDEDYEERNEQFLKARYLYEKNNDPAEKATKDKRRIIPRQDLMVLTVSQTSLEGHRRRRRTPQDSRVEQMKYKLEEVWQARRVDSQTSLEESSCRSQSPPPTKCPPLKRVAKIRRRRAVTPQCPVNKTPEPKCGCSKPCQSPTRCRSRLARASTAPPQKPARRSCSEMDLTANTYRRMSPKSSSAPCNKHEEDDWHHLKYEQLSLTSFEERNLYGGLSQMDVSPNDRCSCAKSKASEDNDLPFGICSTASQMDLAMQQPVCSKTAPKNKMEDLSGCSKSPNSPHVKTLQKCMSCGKFSIPVPQANKADSRPKCTKVSPKTNMANVMPACKTNEAPPMRCINKVVPIGRCPTPPQLHKEDKRHGRYFSAAPFRKNLHKKTSSGSAIQCASAPPIEKEAESDKVSIQSQTDFTVDQKSVDSQTELDREEYRYSRLAAAPSSSFKYTEKPTVSEKLPTAPIYVESQSPTQSRRLSAPANLSPFVEKPQQSDKDTIMPVAKDSSKHVIKTTNTQPVKKTSITPQTDITKENKTIKAASLDAESSKDRWMAVPGLHGMHEIKTPERRSSLKTSASEREAISHVSLRKEVVEKPTPEEKVKDVKAKRKNFKSSSKATTESIPDITVEKSTPPVSPKKLTKQASVKDTTDTETKRSESEKALSPAKTAPDNSSQQANQQIAINAGLTDLAAQNVPSQELSKGRLTRDSSLSRTPVEDSSLPRRTSVDRSYQRSSSVDFNLKKDSLKAASQSSLSKNSHGSSSSAGSSDSVKDTRL